MFRLKTSRSSFGCPDVSRNNVFLSGPRNSRNTFPAKRSLQILPGFLHDDAVALMDSMIPGLERSQVSHDSRGWYANGQRATVGFPDSLL
jgi:hypothetical protein